MTTETNKDLHLVKCFAFLICIAILGIGIEVLIIPAHAQTITMANPQGVTERDIIVYWPNGSMQGYYNSTSVITLDNSSDYIFTMKPLSLNPLEDPAEWLETLAFPFVQTNILGLVIIIILIAIYRRGG